MKPVNEPQLSAEMEERFDAFVADHSNWDDSAGLDVDTTMHFLATALEEQRLGYIEQVNKLMTVRVMDDRFLDTPFLYKSDVLAIITKKEQ